MQDMDCSDVNTSDIFWNGAVIFNDSFLSRFSVFEWYHHSTIKCGSQSFFTRCAHFLPFQIGSVLVKKFAISPETATFVVGNPSVGTGRRWGVKWEKAVFFPFSPPLPDSLRSAERAAGQAQVVNLTLQDDFEAGSFPTGRTVGLTGGKGEIRPFF